jgi:hypothetical protein
VGDVAVEVVRRALVARDARHADGRMERKEIRSMFVQRSTRYPDLEALVDYRAYEGGGWGSWFEETWLKPRLRELGYAHVRFFGGMQCDYDGSFRKRVCEVKKPNETVQYFVYG